VNGIQDDALSRLTSDEWFTLGRASAEAYARNEEWLFRRVEAIDFVDRRSVKRTVTVDFEVPRGLPHLGKRAARGTSLVPIAVMQKWPPTMDFHLSDQQGHTLSRYRGTTTRKLDFGLLLGMMDRVLGKRDASNPATTRIRQTKAGRRLGRTPADHVVKALLLTLAEIVEDPEPTQDQVAQAMIGLETLLKGAHPFKPGSEPKSMREYMDKLAKTVDLAGRLAAGSILWVATPGRPGTDRIVKFSYLGAHLDSRPDFPDAPKHLSRIVKTPAKRLAISCAWRTRTMVIPLLHAGRDIRYHLDVRAPGGSVEMEKVTAVAMPPADDAKEKVKEPEALSVAALADKYPKILDRPDEWVGPQSTGYFMDYGEPTHVVSSTVRENPLTRPPGDATAEIIDRQAHVYLGKEGAPSHRVILQLKLKAAREGMIRGCAFAAAIIAVLMWVVYVGLEGAAKHAEMTVVLLSIVPVVLGYVVVRPDEQPFEHEHLKGVRAMALLAGALPIAGALLLALTLKKAGGMDPDFPAIKPTWMYFSIASTVLALTLAVSYFRAAPSKAKEKRWRRWLHLERD
jgi:hypothetical protein